jgi:hypothetical protein
MSFNGIGVPGWDFEALILMYYALKKQQIDGLLEPLAENIGVQIGE